MNEPPDGSGIGFLRVIVRSSSVGNSILTVPSVPSPMREHTALNLRGHSFAASSTVYVPKWAIACPTGLRGLSDADFERSADIICQENQPLALYMAIPLTPGFAACAGAVGTMLLPARL